jgi:hypothetical protein
MNKPTHTPAPWSLVQGGTGDSPTWNVRIGPSLVYLPGAFDMSVMDANARLIAAAPELLDALQWALSRIASKAPHQASEGDAELYAFASAMSALKKATQP